MTKPKVNAVDLTLLALALVWGGSYLAAKNLSAFSSVQGMLAVRFGVATLALLLIWVFRPVRFTKWDLRLGVLFGTTQSAIMAVETWGLWQTSATNAGLIISLTIIFTPMLESLWSRNWLPPKFFIAAVTAVVGVALLVGDHGFKTPNLGDLLMLAAALFRTFHVTAQGRFTKGRQVSSFNIITLQCFMCTFWFFVWQPSGAVQAVTNYGLAQWLDILFLALLCSVFAFVAQLWAIRRTSATRSSLLLGTEPVWAVLIAAAFGGEALGWVGAIGAVVIVGSTYWGQSIESRHRAKVAAGSPGSQTGEDSGQPKVSGAA